MLKVPARVRHRPKTLKTTMMQKLLPDTYLQLAIFLYVVVFPTVYVCM